MTCDSDQYSKFLRGELRKTGYVEKIPGTYSPFEDTSYVVTFPEGVVAMVNIPHTWPNMFYVGPLNADKFLAAAAMRTSPQGGYGEWWKCLENVKDKWEEGDKFTAGQYYKSVAPLDPKKLCIIDNFKDITGCNPHPDPQIFKKATIFEVLHQLF